MSFNQEKGSNLWLVHWIHEYRRLKTFIPHCHFSDLQRIYIYIYLHKLAVLNIDLRQHQIHVVWLVSKASGLLGMIVNLDNYFEIFIVNVVMCNFCLSGTLYPLIIQSLPLSLLDGWISEFRCDETVYRDVQIIPSFMTFC